MKKLTISTILVICSVVSGLAQITFYKGQNILMPENLPVNYRVNLKRCINMVDGICQDTIEKPLVDNKEILNLFGIIFQGVFDKKLKIYQTDILYNYSSQIYPMSLDDVREKMDAGQTKIMVEDVSGNLVEKTVEMEMDTSELFGLTFIEDWQLTEKPFSMTKKVIGYCPIRKYYKGDYDDGQVFFKSLFLCLDTITNKKEINKSNKRMILTNKINYEYFLIPEVYNDVKKGISLYYNAIENCGGEGWLFDYNSPYFNNEGKSRLINLIIKKALKENYPVYDFETNKQLSLDEIKSNTDSGVDSVMVEDVENPGNFIVKAIEKQLDIREIKSIIFHEEWYIDPITLRMHKKVTGISPVRYYYQWSSFKQTDMLVKKVIFTMYFDGIKHP
jgi:hypothetical protein